MREVYLGQPRGIPTATDLKKVKDAYVPGRTLKWLKVKQPRYREGERGCEPKG